ncbi:MAG TPA: sulfate adenylyltransferase [Thermoanaerobaculia bacterium]|nr:sulfate adenylyltransferase [Thermoanaerobaculia bacterium]
MTILERESAVPAPFAAPRHTTSHLAAPFADELVAPHGGKLVDRFVRPDEVIHFLDHASRLPAITLDPREQADLELIATGAASPLTGFLGAADYGSVLARLRLSDGTVWPLPLTLAVDGATAAQLSPGGEAALYAPASQPGHAGPLLGVVQVEEIFDRDPLAEARAVYGTEDAAHPGVAYLLARPRTLVGGPVRALPLPETLPFAEHRYTPRELRQEIARRGWQEVAGFQTRNPIHRAHEHLTKLALEQVDGLVIHPLVGETKGDDVPATVRFQTYEALVARYYPPERTLLAAFPAAMRYAGPREALFHALVRKNYGINRLIVGRDHAGVGKYYGPYEAQEIFERFSRAELGVAPLKLEPTFYCRTCGALASTRTCPHPAAERLELSGSRVREILREGGELPAEFTRPEVAAVLRAHFTGTAAVEPARAEAEAEAKAEPAAQAATVAPAVAEVAHAATNGHHRRGFILWLTGLSGAGKSTLAQAVRGALPAGAVEVLDGDEFREQLSKGLGFSRQDRDTNVRRIGYVARLLARHGVGVVTAAISPYADTRAEVRSQAEAEGIPFLEIFATAPLETLVARDVKGLYAKALRGEIDHFTGVSDPYEAPPRPEVAVHSDRETVEEGLAKVLEALAARLLVSPAPVTSLAVAAELTVSLVATPVVTAPAAQESTS